MDQSKTSAKCSQEHAESPGLSASPYRSKLQVTLAGILDLPSLPCHDLGSKKNKPPFLQNMGGLNQHRFGYAKFAAEGSSQTVDRLFVGHFNSQVFGLSASTVLG